MSADQPAGRLVHGGSVTRNRALTFGGVVKSNCASHFWAGGLNSSGNRKRIEIGHAVAVQFARADIQNRPGADLAAVKFALEILDDELGSEPMAGKGQVIETKFGAGYVAHLHPPIQGPGRDPGPWPPSGPGRRHVRARAARHCRDISRAETHGV